MKNNETKKRIVHHKLEVGKALSLEPTIMLDVYDHEMDLQDRYEDEQLNPLFDTKVVNYKANNSMGRDDYREERVKRAVKKYGKTLWHYTDINALCGIIGKKEIWFGSAEHMNDREELIGFINDLEKEVYNLLLCAMFHKHESFSSEQEIRISPLFVNENDKHLQCKVLNTIRQVYILNLAELCEKERIDFEDLFDSIVIGPTSKQTIRDLQIYCKNNGLLKLANKVKKSDCPLR